KSAVGERAKDGLVQRAAMELHRGDIDRDADMFGPGRGARARLAHHPRADRDDEAGVLGDRNEVGGRDQPQLRMTPAEQRLERADPILFEIEQRLVVKLEFAALQRKPQVALYLATILRPLVETLLEKGVGPTTGLLGAVKRKV